jgi:ribosomal protein S18 acetylase RimI-like enzyme
MGLTPAQLEAIADLERLVVGADGGRLKLEWGTLRSRSGSQVSDLLWWEDGRLLGFVGLYAFGGPVELAGMVAPTARRRGIGTALLLAGLDASRGLAPGQILLVVPRGSAGGKALAQRHGGVLEHSEHALVLLGEPEDGPSDPRVTLRRAGPDDAAVVGRLLEDAFGHPATGLAELLGSDEERTLVVELDGAPVGTVRLTADGEQAGVYGFAVDPAHQGRGIGRDVLRRVCRLLRADGARRVGLEVATDNDRALGLYTSLGFTDVSTEDYYEMPVSGRPAQDPAS